MGYMKIKRYRGYICVFFLLLFLFAGCARRNQYVSKIDTVYVAKTDIRLDSVYIDRWRTTYMAGDTVYKVDSVRLFRYRDRLVTDTMHHYSTDTCYVTKEVAKAAGRSGYDVFTSWGFWILLVLVLLYIAGRVVYWLWKNKLK